RFIRPTFPEVSAPEKKSEKILVRAGCQHHQCAMVQGFYTCVFGHLLQFTVFSTRIEDDPLGLQRDNVVVPGWLVLRSHIQRYRIYTFYFLCFICNNGLSAYLSFTNADWHYVMAMLLQPVNGLVSKAGRII